MISDVVLRRLATASKELLTRKVRRCSERFKALMKIFDIKMQIFTVTPAVKRV
jgi:hypothetical protein